MPEKFIAALFCVLMFVLPAEPVTPETPPQDGTQAPESVETPSQPDTPKQVMNIEVKDGLLSIELAEADFGAVMNSIAQKSGFKAEVSGDVYAKKLTTKFTGIELERGITRLLTLIGEKNYLIRYDTKGAVSKVEIYGGLTPAAAVPKQQTPLRPPVSRPTTPMAPAPQPTRQMPAPSSVPGPPMPSPSSIQPGPPMPAPSSVPGPPAMQSPSGAQKGQTPLRRTFSTIRQKRLQKPQPPQPKQEPQEVQEKEPVDDEDLEDAIEEIPYVPAPKTP